MAGACLARCALHAPERNRISRAAHTILTKRQWHSQDSVYPSSFSTSRSDTLSPLSSRPASCIAVNWLKVSNCSRGAHVPTRVLNREYLLPAEDNLNISLRDITVTGRDGRVSQLDQVYIRGSMIRFFIVPDMLQNAPMYVRFDLTSLRVADLATGSSVWARTR